MPLTIRPLIIAEGSEPGLVLAGLSPGRRYRLDILPVREPATRLTHELTADGVGRLAWTQPATWRGEALCDVYAPEGEAPLATLHLYSAPPQVLRRRPLRADFHAHTTYSDGKNSPAEMVVRARELGLDALAITDHNNHEGSLSAIAAANRLGLGLVCYTGEEVSAPDWHLLAVDTSGPAGADARQAGYQGLRAGIDAVHRLGGRAYLAHPYWTVQRRHHLPPAVYDRLLAAGGFDGVELIGDVAWEDNLRSLARYTEACAAGRTWPILGNSDTHSATHTFGANWTLVLAREPTRQGILSAIEELSEGRCAYSAACTVMTFGPPAQPVRARFHVFGPYELVDLAIFLDRHYFPLHDALCREEAALARRASGGDVLPPGAMAAVAGELEDLYRACWQP